jgi:hypothetical protein
MRPMDSRLVHDYDLASKYPYGLTGEINVNSG